MRRLTETKALVRLKRIKDGFSVHIGRFSQKAVDCAQCQTPCCADAQFVNVNITRLEAAAIVRTLQLSPRIGAAKFRQIRERAAQAVEQYRLGPNGDTFKQTYACPLFEPGTGCLVHYKAKPAPCIQHGCYEDWRDVPDLTEFHRVQRRVENLHHAIGEEPVYYPIPVWLTKIMPEPVAQVRAVESADHEERAEG